MLQAYLNAPPSLANRLLSGKIEKPVTVIAAREQATQRVLDEWQSAWDKLSRKNVKR